MNKLLSQLDLSEYINSYENYLARKKPLFLEGDIHLHHRHIRELFNHQGIKSIPELINLDRAIGVMQKSGVLSQDEIFAFVKNKTHNGGFYWVYANVTPSVDDRGNIVGYYSVRRKVNETNLHMVEDLYAKLLEEERRGGIQASEQFLNDLLNKKGVTYDEFIASIQG